MLYLSSPQLFIMLNKSAFKGTATTHVEDERHVLTLPYSRLTNTDGIDYETLQITAHEDNGDIIINSVKAYESDGTTHLAVVDGDLKELMREVIKNNTCTQ